MENKKNNILKGGIFINPKKEKLLIKLKRISGLSLTIINSIENIENFQAIFIDGYSYKKIYKRIKKIDFNNRFKFFIFVNKKNANKIISKNKKDYSIYSFIPEKIEFSKIQELVNKFIESYNIYVEKENILDEFNKQSRNFDNLNKIGISLSVIRDIDTLLDLILTKSREITSSDAGSIYLVEEKIIEDREEIKVTEKVLKFVHSQNFSFPIKTQPFTIPLSKKSIAGYCALTGQIINIEDAHKIPKEADYSYSIETEKIMKVHNRSLISVPMMNHNGEIIGVIQLFNKKKDFSKNISGEKDFDEYVIPFTKNDELIVMSLASQAAVSIENSFLYKEIKNIFEGFIKASVVAIESRDPTTSGHSGRVALLTTQLARMVNRVDTGPYKDIKFSEEDIKIIEYASLLHDFGKIGVREKVLVKANKLYPEELELLKTRYKYLEKSIKYEFANKKLNIIKEKGLDYFNKIEKDLDIEMNNLLNELNGFLQIIIKANHPSILEEDAGKILANLINKKFITGDGEEIDYLTLNEMNSLSILKGSLTEEERKEIESHVTHTFNFLCKIPWTKEMSGIPYIAYKHHEKLDGHGYPRGINSQQIPIQARMMTIADIYDALTASDRPYKKSVPPEKALDILVMEKVNGKIDGELLRIFIEANVYKILNN